MWGPFNCLMTYAWSRAASLIYAGERDGLGFRDTVQDMLGVMHAISGEAVRAAGADDYRASLHRRSHAGGEQFAHHPGSERAPREEEYRSDDCLWLFNAIPAYVKETGDLAFYRKGPALCRQRRRHRARPHEARHRIQPGAHGRARPALRPLRRLERLHSPGPAGRDRLCRLPTSLRARGLSWRSATLLARRGRKSWAQRCISTSWTANCAAMPGTENGICAPIAAMDSSSARTKATRARSFSIRNPGHC